MPDENPSPGADLFRQARQHLQSLQNAGIEFVSPKPLPVIPFPPSSAAAQPVPLFEKDSPSDGAQAGAKDLTLEQRRQALELLAEQVSTCPRCPELMAIRKQTVFGQGEPGVELCFIGEAPGQDEDDQGIPFVGAAGQLLNRIIAACGLKREEIYICNILKCHPPRNRTPLASEAANCRSYLDRQLELVAPKYIVALGNCAAQNLLGTTLSMSKLRGRFHDYRGVPVLCTYHPAYLLPHRSPEKKKEVWEDMKFLLKRMGRTLPAK